MVPKAARYYCIQRLNYALAGLFKHETMEATPACLTNGVRGRSYVRVIRVSFREGAQRKISYSTGTAGNGDFVSGNGAMKRKHDGIRYTLP